MNKFNPQIFKEYDIRGKYPEEIKPGDGYFLGLALARAYKLKKIILARDQRPESKFLAADFAQGLLAAGVKIFDLGVDATPAMFFGVGINNFPAGAMVTASHNPKGHTGIKMCAENGLLLGAKTGLSRIVKLAEAQSAKIKKTKTNRREFSVLADYYRFVFSLIGHGKIKGFKLVLDNSGGSGAKLIDHIFVRLSSRVIKMNFRPRDKYPDHDLNPMLAKNHYSLQKEVKKQKAHLGVIWDGDADRCLLVDGRGNFVEPFYFNCLLAKIVLEKLRELGFVRPKIVIDARLPLGLSRVIKENGGQAVVGRAGYANLVRLIQAKKILFGCENSGHYFFNFLIKNRNKNYVYGDGILPVLLLLEYLAERHLSLEEAVAPYQKKYFISGEINLTVKLKFEKIKAKIKKQYNAYRLEEIDGLSVYGGSWFFNLRPSKTEPLARLNIEASSKKEVAEVKKGVLKLVK